MMVTNVQKDPHSDANADVQIFEKCQLNKETKLNLRPQMNSKIT